jgi:adenine-specific DNA-methyltransferase
MGMQVMANDWEPFTRWINGCHLQMTPRELDRLFSERGGIDPVLEALNRRTTPLPENRYISRYYAPGDTAQADHRTERLFYTTENALRLDVIRQTIEDWYPPDSVADNPLLAAEKTVLMASLLYQAATHTNTSGVFKAYHRGFGGHSRDALRRIMAPIRLLRPALVDCPYPATVCSRHAADFAASHSGDICYLDPPYNQHQYGSNYHLLNTVCLWDRPPVSDAIGEDGRLVDKAGIRKDWVQTRSEFCSRPKARQALEDLLASIDCPLILLSYNMDGNISHPELLELLQTHGHVEVRTQDHAVYRGGRQSLNRRSRSVEVLWVLDRRRRMKRSDRALVRRQFLTHRLEAVAAGRFDPSAVRRQFDSDQDGVKLGDGAVVVMPDLYRFEDPSAVVRQTSPARHASILRGLERCLCRDRDHQIQVLVKLLDGGPGQDRRLFYGRELLTQLRKLAHKKYRRLFADHCARILDRAELQPDRFGELRDRILELKALARRRAAG